MRSYGMRANSDFPIAQPADKLACGQYSLELKSMLTAAH
jgi:hypothetical protein